MNFLAPLFSYLRSTLSEPDGNGSATRLCMVALVSFVIGAGVMLCAKLHTVVLPGDINNFLAAAGVFIATTCGPLYLINKGADTLKSNNSQQNANAAPPVVTQP